MAEFRNDELEYGEVLYEVSNAKTMYDGPTGKVGAKGWAQRIYMLLLGTGLFGWFVYSLVGAISEYGVAIALLNHAAAFFVLLVAELILMLSAFGGWGKFARFAIKNNLIRKRGVEGANVRNLAREINTADSNKGNENAIRIYREKVVIVNEGETVTISQSELHTVRCDAVPKGYKLTFVLYDGREIVARVLLPLSDLPLIKKHFDRFDYTPTKQEKGRLKNKLPVLAIAFVPILVGIGAILLHFFVFEDMPILFGIFFMSVGILIAVGQFSDVPVIQHGVMPIGFGLLLTGLPVGVMYTIAQLSASSENPITIASMLTTFTPIHAGLGLFLGLGPMLIIVGIAGLANCIRMR